MFLEALFCLALTVYHEARSEDVQGQAAVAEVVMNRAKTQDRVCEVVFTRKQFTWANEITTAQDVMTRRLVSKPYYPAETKAWNLSLRIARLALAGELSSGVGGSDHYYNWKEMKNKPSWAGSMTKVKKVGAHAFYQSQGDLRRHALASYDASRTILAVDLRDTLSGILGDRYLDVHQKYQADKAKGRLQGREMPIYREVGQSYELVKFSGCFSEYRRNYRGDGKHDDNWVGVMNSICHNKQPVRREEEVST